MMRANLARYGWLTVQSLEFAFTFEAMRHSKEDYVINEITSMPHRLHRSHSSWWRRLFMVLVVVGVVSALGATPVMADVVPIDDPSAGQSAPSMAGPIPLVPGDYNSACRPILDPGDGSGGEDEPCVILVPSNVCSPTIRTSTSRTVEADVPGSRVTWNALVFCMGVTPAIFGNVVLYDRTEGRDGNVLTSMPAVGIDNPPNGTAGSAFLPDFSHPNGSQVEVVMELTLVLTNGSRWNACNALSGGLRYVRPCEGLGTGTLRVWVGGGNFTPEVAPFCPRGSWVATLDGRPFDQRHFVTLPPLPWTGDVSGPVLARPLVRAQWCAENNGNVTKMQVIATSPDRLVTELDGRTVGNTQAVQTSRDGKIAYELHFDFEYAVNKDFGIGPFSLKFGTKCTINIHLIYTHRPAPRNETINVCDPWRVGGS